jgi:hypothetical protein
MIRIEIEIELGKITTSLKFKLLTLIEYPLARCGVG